MDKKILIVGMCGSLRKKSLNKSALLAAKKLLPEEVELSIIDLSAVPFFNEDVEALGVPKAVESLKKAITQADAVLLATPEYNYSIPPVLKNALDWVSRGSDHPFVNKPTALMSASPSFLGGARVQYHLRQVLLRLNAATLNTPEVFITHADKKFDASGELIDDYTKKSITKLITALVTRAMQ